MTSSRPRSRAELVTLVCSVLVLTVVVGLLVVQAVRDQAPADPRAAVEKVVEGADGRHVVSVAVHNRGGHAAENVEVNAELTVDGTVVASGSQVVDFLGAGETAELRFVLGDDPADGELVVAVASYAQP